MRDAVQACRMLCRFVCIPVPNTSDSIVRRRLDAVADVQRGLRLMSFGCDRWEQISSGRCVTIGNIRYTTGTKININTYYSIDIDEGVRDVRVNSRWVCA